MGENIRKFLLYFRPIITYWKLSDQESAIIKSKIGIYPSSISPRIDQNHYNLFDKNGIPQVLDKYGVRMYHWTTICSYALGLWEKYLQSNNKILKEKFLKIANFLKNNVVFENDTAIFLHYKTHKKKTTNRCGMIQGEAISVLIRAHEITSDNDFIEIAFKASNLFSIDYDSGGVSKKLPNSDDKWYLEIGKFILNGHIYGCWGLYELWKYTGSNKAKTLFDNGLKSLTNSLEDFDKGWWSKYWLDKPDYIASIMYHNLHIIQIKYLYKISNLDTFQKYSQKFENYAKNPINRIFALLSLTKSKIFKN